MSRARLRWVVPATLVVVLTAAYLGWRLTRGSNQLGVSSVVLVTLDGVRADALGCYGADPSPTPVLDRLARAGVRFERCLSSSPSSLPAHASMFSGRDPVAHGCRVDGAFAFAPDNPSLALVMKQHGFLTGAFVSSPAVGRGSGLALGFDQYDDQSVRADGLPRPDAAGRPGEYTVDAALEFVDLAGSAPLFLWVHLDDGHGPHHPSGTDAGGVDRLYASNLGRVDRQIERLLAGLEGRGRLDGALLVIAGGHGEGLGEHGEWGHSLLLHDSTLRVPLIFWRNGRLAPGRVVERTISTVSLAPTLLDLLDLERPPGMYSASRAGDLAGRPGAIASAGAELICFETAAPGPRYGFANLSGIELEGYKLIVGPKAGLFRPRDDPGEQVDLSSREPHTVKRLRAALEAQLARHSRSRGAGGRVLSDATRERLARIGLAPVPAGTAGAERALGSPRSPDTGLGVVAAIRQAGRLWSRDRAAARTLLDDLLTAEPDVAEVHRLNGRLSGSVGEHLEALESLRRVVELSPGDPGGYFEWGRGLAALERLDDAEACLLAALELDPSHLPARLALGRLYLDSRRFALARVRFDQVLAVSPGLVEACLGRAICLLEMNNIRLADEDLRTALAGDPEQLRILTLLVRSCLLLANQEDALKFYLRALALGADLPWPEGLDRPERG